MPRSLPPSPSLEHLKKEAKDLLHDCRSGHPSAMATLKLLPRFANATDTQITAAEVSLSEAQQALAMHYGYKNWNTLRELVTDTFTPDQTLPPAEFYEDYRWSQGNPIGVNLLSDLPKDRPFFKFIPLPNGVRIEQYGPGRILLGICHDPSDRDLGDRKITWSQSPTQCGATRLDSLGRVRSYEHYTILTDEQPPRVKAEIYTADGRLIGTHTPHRLSPSAEDIHVTDRLGKLKVILHHRNIDKGEPYNIEEEWPE